MTVPSTIFNPVVNQENALETTERVLGVLVVNIQNPSYDIPQASQNKAMQAHANVVQALKDIRELAVDLGIPLV